MGTVQSSSTMQTDFRSDFPSQQAPQVFSVHISETAPQTHVYPVQTQVVGQTRVVPVQTTVVHSRSDVQSSGAGICSWIITTVMCVISAVFCTGVLIAATIALSAINEVDDIANERSGEYEDADSYRGAAGWLVFVGSAAIVFDVVMISIQILYFKCTVKKYFTQYSIINAIFCILFALALLAGGIANAIYATDNSELRRDTCFFDFNFVEDELCENLERVRDAEIASVALSFFSMFIFITMFVSILYTGLASNDQRLSSQPQGAVPYPSSTHVSPYQPLTNTSQYPPPMNTSQYPAVLSSAPPSYDGLTNPPSYESVTAPTY